MESVVLRARAGAPPSVRIVELDSLRGIAAIGVALFHLGLPGTGWMWSFVDLFFVLSGFVITRLLLVPPELNGAVLRAFWMRRILRIWPVYYVTLLLVLAIHALRSAFGGALEEPTGVLPLFFFLQFTDLYLTPAPHPGWIELNREFLPYFLHSWSLAVEEQFYLAWPLLLIVMRRKPAAVLGCVLLALSLSYAARSLGFSQYLLLARMDGLLLGACLALVERHVLSAVPDRNRMLGAVFVTLAAGALAATVRGGVTAADTRPALVTEFGVLYAGIVGALICFPRARWTAALRWRWLVYLGGISYALYMFHLPIFGVGSIVLAKAGIAKSLWTNAALLAAVIGCAALSRVLLERPVERLKQRLAGASDGGILVGVRS